MIKRWISGILSAVMLLTFLSGCVNSNTFPDETGKPSSSETTGENATGKSETSGVQTVESDTDGSEMTKAQEEETDHETVPAIDTDPAVETDPIGETEPEDETQPVDDPTEYSERWEDYVGDIETFAYGLIISELDLSYDVFPAYVELSDGNTVFGIGFTDYTNCFSDLDSKKFIFSAGFLPFDGERDLTEEELKNGLIVHDLVYQEAQTSFVLTRSCEPFMSHCVVYDQYLKYGIDNDHKIVMQYTKYTESALDKSLGNLYSYDTKGPLYILEEIEYHPTSGQPLTQMMDFDAIQNEMNRIIEQQNANFMTVEIETHVGYSQQAVVSYFLSLQKETFLGYPVEELIECANRLSVDELANELSSDNVLIRPINSNSEEEVTKWIVRTAYDCTRIANFVISVLLQDLPMVTTASELVEEYVSDLFMQIIDEKKSVDEVEWNRIDWKRIVIRVISSAVCTGLNYVASLDGTEEVFTRVLELVSAGLCDAAVAWSEGEDFKTIVKSFGEGAAIAFTLSSLMGPVYEKLETICKEKTSSVGEKALKVVELLASSFVYNSAYKAVSKAETALKQFAYLGRKTLNSLLKKDEPNSTANTLKSNMHVDDDILSKFLRFMTGRDHIDDIICA